MVSDPFSSDRDVEDIQPHVFKPEERLVAHAMPMKHQIAGPGPLAIISDVHGNLEALTSVLAEIDRRGVKRIICLGDIIGYGPNPLECIDIVMQRCEFSLMGNHDFAILFEPYNFNTAAENAAFWTRTQFEMDANIDCRNRRWKYIGCMPTRMANDRFVCFHGSPRRPINEYVFPDDIYTAPQKMSAIFDRFERLCFVGHTHVPGVFVPDPDFYSPEELNNRFTVTDERAMVNVGSVGQPRDRNPNASFVILHDSDPGRAAPPEVPGGGEGGGGGIPDGGEAAGGGVASETPAETTPAVPAPTSATAHGVIEFIRVPYDVETTVEKVKAIEALDNFLGTRLLDGR